MAITVTIEEAQANLREFIRQLAPGEEIIIAEEQRPVAQLRLQGEPPKRPAPGLGKGSVLFMSPDFDEPLGKAFRKGLRFKST